MKKFRITDDEGNDYEVEEIEETVENEEVFLTQDEIISLKELAANAPSILALLDNEVVDAKKEEDKIKDEDEEEIKDEDEDKEEVIDSEEQKIKDSKKSYGAIEKTKKVVDSFDREEEIAKAWSKRYGGK